jgi:alkanesulfonate monooxygenase SsuD/methylene tetrahydromethanopterin reductase-like flavin-dependent oxidoreductase (luciferase family)
MHFGVGDFSGQRPPGDGPDHSQLYEELLQQARLMDQVGLDSMWVSEHHFADDGYMPSVLVICAAALAVTSRLTVATDRLEASLHNALRLAEDATTLDLIGRGRFILGLSLNYRDEELRGFGLTAEGEPERLEAMATHLRRLFRDGDSPLRPRPYSAGGPQLMIAADGPNTDGAKRAAALADLVMLDPTLSWDSIVHQIEAYRGFGGIGEPVIFVYGGLSPDGKEAAWNEIESGFRYMRHNYDRWMGRPLTRELPPPGYRMLLGTPAEVKEQVKRYRDSFGDGTHLVLRLNYPGMTSARVAEQMRMWGDVAADMRDGR